MFFYVLTFARRRFRIGNMEDDFDRDDDFTSGNCPSCGRTIYTESACVASCHHCGWTSEPEEDEEEAA